GWLILFTITLRLVAACPASCALCTEDATLCQQLTYIVAAPVTTRVLIITDGYLSSIESTNLCVRRCWSTTKYPAPRSPTTPSASSAVCRCSLSHNALRTLRGSWFQDTRGLTRLQLDSNQIPSLTDSSFAGTNLHSLRHLDLSNNFISYVGKAAFRPLPQLQELDLSRNRLAHMPDVFTPLKRLILLSLDKNQDYIKSSACTLRNAQELNCQPSTTAVTTAKNMLRLSETNCNSKAPNLTLVLKDSSPLLPGQDVALLTVLGFAGVVGLICLGLAVFNWKLQHGIANEHTSENLCCRTFDESLCVHDARNYHAKGHCNCHLTQENEIKVMSIIGSRKEMPLLQENSHQTTLASESTGLDGSFRNLNGKDRGADGTFFCSRGRLLQSQCSEPPKNMSAFNETDLLTRACPKRVEKLRNLETGEVQPQILQQCVTRAGDMSSDTFRRRYAISVSALARESHGKRLTNESWQPPIEKEDNGLQPHRQRHFITGSSSKSCEPEKHYVQKILQKHRSKYDDPCSLLKGRPGYFQPNNSLICEYVPCEQFQDYVKEEPNCRAHSKPKKEQIQINSAIKKFLMHEDNMELSGLSTKIKEMYSPKRVSFHSSDLVEQNRLVMSSKTSTHLKQKKNQSNLLTSLDLKKCSNLGERIKGGKWLSDPHLLRKRRANPSYLKGKSKGQNSRIKLNVYPFRKVRIHPEKSLPELPKKCRQVLLPPNKLSEAPEKEDKINLVSSADFLQQPESNNYVRLNSKRFHLKYAPKKTPYYPKTTHKAPLFSAANLPVATQSSVEGNCYPTGHIPDGNPSTLPQATPLIAEHKYSASQFSVEQMEGAAHLTWEVPSYLPITWENIGSDVLTPCYSRGATNQGVTEPSVHIEQDQSKTSELNQFSVSLGNQTQLVGVHKTDTYKECTSDQNQILQHVEEAQVMNNLELKKEHQ
ncbi:hypothetical protein MC885_008603, partial [Smutsia gigantea]